MTRSIDRASNAAPASRRPGSDQPAEWARRAKLGDAVSKGCATIHPLRTYSSMPGSATTADEAIPGSSTGSGRSSVLTISESRSRRPLSRTYRMDCPSGRNRGQTRLCSFVLRFGSRTTSGVPPAAGTRHTPPLMVSGAKTMTSCRFQSPPAGKAPTAAMLWGAPPAGDTRLS